MVKRSKGKKVKSSTGKVVKRSKGQKVKRSGQKVKWWKGKKVKRQKVKCKQHTAHVSNVSCCLQNSYPRAHVMFRTSLDPAHFSSALSTPTSSSLLYDDIQGFDTR